MVADLSFFIFSRNVLHLLNGLRLFDCVYILSGTGD